MRRTPEPTVVPFPELGESMQQHLLQVAGLRIRSANEARLLRDFIWLSARVSSQLGRGPGNTWLFSPAGGLHADGHDPIRVLLSARPTMAAHASHDSSGDARISMAYSDGTGSEFLSSWGSLL